MKPVLASPFVPSALPIARRFAAPAPARAVGEVGELARRLAGPFGFALRRPHLRCQPGLEAAVAGKAEHILDAIGLAPAHEIVAAEPAVGADHDGRRRPALADLADDARDLGDAAVGGIDARRAQLGREQVATTERHRAAGSSSSRSSRGNAALPARRKADPGSSPGPVASRSSTMRTGGSRWASRKISTGSRAVG